MRHIILIGLCAILVYVLPSGKSFAEPPVEASSTHTQNTNMPAGPLVYKLPHARGRGFATLDDYLIYLKTLSATDIPYYRAVDTDLYERSGGRRPPGAAAPARFTRAQLAEMFGFTPDGRAPKAVPPTK